MMASPDTGATMTSGAQLVPSGAIVCGTGARVLRRPSTLGGQFVAVDRRRISAATR